MRIKKRPQPFIFKDFSRFRYSPSQKQLNTNPHTRFLSVLSHTAYERLFQLICRIYIEEVCWKPLVFSV
jgi:hypothetical protein